MGAIKIEDIILPGAVTVISCYQLSTFARAVGKARHKHKVEPPETDGPPEFVRTFRAQQNNLEFFPLYMGCLWTSSIFFHPVPSSAAGIVYLYARGRYFKEYARDAEARVPPFLLSVKCLQMFLLMSSLGLTQSALLEYADINLKELLGLDKYLKF